VNARVLRAAAVALALLIAVSTGTQRSDAQQATGVPYELQAILSTTGPGAFLGASAAKTLKVIEDLTNQTGGIHGRSLRIVVSDDQSSPQVAVQLTNALVQKGVPVILGPSLTATCAANGPLVAKSGPLIYCVSPYIDPAAGSYVFANGPTAMDNAVVVLRYYRARGLHRIAMLNATDASGQVLDKSFEAAFALPENKSLELVAHQHFAPTDVTVAAQVAQIKASNPQAIIAWTVGSPFNTVIRGTHDAGLDVPICTNGANMNAAQMADLASSLPSELDFAGYPSWVQGAKLPAPVMKAQAVFTAAFKSAGIHPDGGYASVWDLTTLVVDALRHLPADPKAQQVRDYLAALRNWPGANGTYNFAAFPQRGIGEAGYIIARYDAVKKDFVPVSLPGGDPLRSP
jgi:branched-chain amino acid transport system substrate-binding protein